MGRVRYAAPCKLEFYTNWAIGWLSKDLIRYYRSLIPKYIEIKPPRTDSHISVVRRFENPDKTFWTKYNQEVIVIEYEPYVHTNGLYFWLNAYSDKIVEIRKELGLPAYLGNYTCQHITLGNTK